MAIGIFFELFLVTPQGAVLYCKATCEQYRQCLQIYRSQLRKASAYAISSGNLCNEKPELFFNDEFSVRNIEFVFRTPLIIVLHSTKWRPR